MNSMVNRILILLPGVIVLYICITLLKNIAPFEIQKLLPENHPVRVKFENYSKKYNDVDQVFLLLSKNQSMSPSEIEEIADSLGRVIRYNHPATDVLSINNAKYVKYDHGGFYLEKFVKDGSISKEAREKLTTEVWNRTLISEDFSNLIFTFQISDQLKQKERVPYVKKIMDKVNKWGEKHSQYTIHFIGTEVANYHFTKEMIKNQTIITPLLLIMFGAFFYFLFRSFVLILFAYYVMFLAYAATIVTIILNEGGIGPYSSFALFFVLIISTADLIHFYNTFTYKNGDLKETVKFLYKPCFLTSLTTAIGFFSLILNENIPVRYFGLYCAFGAMLEFFLTFYFLPQLIKVFNVKSNPIPTLRVLKTDMVWSFIKNRAKSIITAFALTSLVLCFFSKDLKINDDLYRKFLPAHPLSLAVDAFSNYFNFVGSVDILVRPKDKENQILDLMELVSEFENELKKLPATSHLKSYFQMMNLVESEIKTGDPKLSKPERGIILGSFHHLLHDYGALGEVYNENDQEVRIMLFLNTLDSALLEKTLKQVTELGKQKKYSDILEIEPNGFAAIRSYINNNVIKDFMSSFACTLVLILIVFWVMLKSFKWALIAMVPNVFPIFTISGLMGLFNVSLESNLVIMVCITLGIAVDDTIHFLTNITRELQKQKSLKEAVVLSLDEMAKALIGTTFVLIFSFPCFFLADLKLFVQVGIFLALSLFFALVADLLLLPALIIVFLNKEKVE